jgi:hypothetical protein
MMKGRINIFFFEKLNVMKDKMKVLYEFGCKYVF